MKYLNFEATGISKGILEKKKEPCTITPQVNLRMEATVGVGMGGTRWIHVWSHTINHDCHSTSREHKT